METAHCQDRTSKFVPDVVRILVAKALRNFLVKEEIQLKKAGRRGLFFLCGCTDHCTFAYNPCTFSHRSESAENTSNCQSFSCRRCGTPVCLGIFYRMNLFMGFWGSVASLSKISLCFRLGKDLLACRSVNHTAKPQPSWEIDKGCNLKTRRHCRLRLGHLQRDLQIVQCKSCARW